MLNRRDLFKGMALVSGVAVATAPAKAEAEGVLKVRPPRMRRAAIPDGPIVGLGYQALLAVFRREVPEERVVKIYMTWNDFHDAMMKHTQACMDNGKTPAANLFVLSDFHDRLTAEGKVSLLHDPNYDRASELADWPVEKLGMWQAHPFVARKDYKPGKWAKRTA